MNPESMLKGRMAETLFEEMMRRCGNIVYRFGYEAIVQNLTQLEERFDRNSEVGERIRAIPDFIVIDKQGKPDFVEVKFRWKPELSFDSDYRMVERIGKFWNASIVFINCWEQPYFRITEPPYFGKTETKTGSVLRRTLALHPLLSVVNWKIEKGIYIQYEDLVHKYLTPTLVPKKR